VGFAVALPTLQKLFQNSYLRQTTINIKLLNYNTRDINPTTQIQTQGKIRLSTLVCVWEYTGLA